MGHKEVGGMEAQMMGPDGTAVMEQIEIDWRFASALKPLTTNCSRAI